VRQVQHNIEATIHCLDEHHQNVDDHCHPKKMNAPNMEVMSETYMKHRMIEKSSSAGCDLEKSRRLMIRVVVREMKMKCKKRH